MVTSSQVILKELSHWTRALKGFERCNDLGLSFERYIHYVNKVANYFSKSIQLSRFTAWTGVLTQIKLVHELYRFDINKKCMRIFFFNLKFVCTLFLLKTACTSQLTWTHFTIKEVDWHPRVHTIPNASSGCLNILIFHLTTH